MIEIFATPDDYLQKLAGLEDTAGAVETVVSSIIAEVRERGDAALRDYSRRFDEVNPEEFRVPQEAMEKAVAYMDPAIKDVWIQAIDNVERFHQRQREESRLEFFDDGTVLGWKVSPIDMVGVYIPGGTAVYPSSLIMNAVPAQIAGVPRIAVVSPPGKDGRPHDDILACCALLNDEAQDEPEEQGTKPLHVVIFVGHQADAPDRRQCRPTDLRSRVHRDRRRR